MSGKTYFLMRDLDHAPNDRIKLGQIISSPASPWDAIARPLEPIPDRRRSFKSNISIQVNQQNHGRFSIWTRFLSSVTGLGVDVDVNHASQDASRMQFERLETQLFDPDDEYLRKAVLEPGPTGERVRDFIKSNPRKAIYMITGVKVAIGARGALLSRTALGGGLRLGVDATPFSGVPVSGGPAVGADRVLGRQIAFGGSSDFVFAYRLRRIIVGKSIRGREHNRGAMVLTREDASPVIVGESTPTEEAEIEIDDAYFESKDYRPDDQSSVAFKALPSVDDGMDGEAVGADDEDDYYGDCTVIVME